MNENKKNKAIGEEIKQTIEASTIHAIPNILRANHWSLRIIWLVFLLVSASACCWDMIINVSTFLDRKVVTNIQVKRPFQLPFPIVSICDRKRDGINFKDLTRAQFLYENISNENIESYVDSWYGNCIRFNSGKSNNGSQIPFKHINGRGFDNSLQLSIKSKIIPMIWFSNETTDSSEEIGIVFSPGFVYLIEINKLTIIKQPRPYSQCVEDLFQQNSYDSEIYKRLFRFSNASSYRFTHCIDFCRQKYLGEMCQLQAKWLGPVYFDAMKVNYQEMNTTEKSCLNTHVNPPNDYLAKCDCPKECITNQYRIDYSFYNDKNAEENNEPELNIFYDKLTETVVSEEPKMDLSALISALGGTLGVFTGSSLLSLVEIIEIIAKIAIILSRNEKNRQVTF